MRTLSSYPFKKPNVYLIHIFTFYLQFDFCPHIVYNIKARHYVIFRTLCGLHTLKYGGTLCQI